MATTGGGTDVGRHEDALATAWVSCRASLRSNSCDRIGSVSIYSARESGTGRAVALKVIDEAAPLFAHEALEREAGYLAMLGTHPHIVTMYQRTTLADGRRALVLEACPSSAAERCASNA